MKTTKLTALVLIFLFFAGNFALAAEEPSVCAQSCVLIEAQSGEILYNKNENDRMLIASTTKIMTALVVLERCDLETEVVIDAAWTGIEGSSMYLTAGQKLTVEELLYGLMLASGNDAAVALACIAAGSVDDFAVLMNEKAAALGCKNTHFENPNGLDAETHYSSAYDLALIAREALTHEEFRRIVSSTAKTVDGLTYTNHNRLLTECDGVFGVKTGYTEAAGRSLVSCCERNGLTLVCVTLSDPDDWNDHKNLYDWAYSRWTREVFLSGEGAMTLQVIGGTQDTVLVLPEDSLSVFHAVDDDVSVEIMMPSFVYAQVRAGETAGYATAYVNGREAGSVCLVYTQTVEKEESEQPTIWERLQTLLCILERKIYTLS